MITLYSDKYLEDIKDLLLELEECIVSIDKDNLVIFHEDYRDKMALLDLKDINDNAINFYNKNDYHARMITNIKKI